MEKLENKKVEFSLKDLKAVGASISAVGGKHPRCFCWLCSALALCTELMSPECPPGAGRRLLRATSLF